MNFFTELLRIFISACVHTVVWLHLHAPQAFFDKTYKHKAAAALIFTSLLALLEFFHSCIRAIVYKIKPTVIKSVDKSLILTWLTSALPYSAVCIVLFLSMSSGKLNWHVAGILVELCVLYPLCGSVINHYIANIPYQTVWDISLTLLTILGPGVIMVMLPIFHNIRIFDIYQACHQYFIYFWITILTILLFSTRATLRQVRQSRDNLINDRIENPSQPIAPPPSYSEVIQRQSPHPSTSSASNQNSVSRDDTKNGKMTSKKGTTSNYEDIIKDETLNQNVKKSQ